MEYSFKTCGHKNILATHKTTLEFTKDKEISRNGDCIVGVNSDFELEKIKRIINNSKKIKLTLNAAGIQEELIAEVNNGFDDCKEIVVRKTEFLSKRTLGINSSKSAIELKRELINYMKKQDAFLLVTIQKYI